MLNNALRFTCTLAVSLLLTGCTALAPAPPYVHVRIVAFNDFHGHLQMPGPMRFPDQDHPGQYLMQQAGGAAHLATAIHAERNGQRHSVVVAAGDLVSASPLVSSMFFDEPTIEVLNSLGLEITSVGNHEFDRGREELLRLINGGCRPEGCVTGSQYAGARFAYLAANVRDTATGKPFLPPYAIREFEGIPIAFIGLALKGTPALVSKYGITGLHFEDEAETANALIPELRARGVEAIVVLIHQGASTRGAYDDPACPGMEGEIVDIVKRLDKAVDLVISGHTHQAYLCRVDGRPVTSAGSYGRFLTEIDLDLDRDNHDVVHAQTNNIRIDPQIFPADPKVAAIVNQYARLAAPRAGRVVAKLSSALSEQANSTGESELGDVIADAQLAATRAAGAQIAFMNQGGIRAPLIPAHGDNSISYGNIFATQPFGNSLVTMTLTGEQIRRLLEQQFTKGVNSADQHPRLIQVSNGFAYAWDATRPTGQRILVDSIRLNGRALASDATFRVTVNSFMADGGDSFSVLTEGLEREVGMPDIDALEAYLSANSPLAAIPYRRIVRAK